MKLQLKFQFAQFVVTELCRISNIHLNEPNEKMVRNEILLIETFIKIRISFLDNRT